MLSNNVQRITNVPRAETVQPQRLQLSAGQVFQGRIMKFFPNNIAALQLGTMNLSARLEYPLSAGQTYWFEVIGGNGVPRLKVLDANDVRAPSSNSQQVSQQNVQHVLQQLGLAQNKANEMLVSSFAKEQLPFSKELIDRGADILKQTGQVSREGIQTLHYLMQKNLPLSKEVFQAVFHTQQAKGTLLNDLQQLVSELGKIEKTNPVLRSYSTGIRSIINETVIPQEKPQVLQLLNQLTSSSSDIRQGSLELLQRLGVLPQVMNSEAPFFEQFKAAVLDPRNRGIVQQLWPNITFQTSGGFRLDTIDSRSFYQLFLSNLNIPEGKEGMDRLQSFLNLIKSSISAVQVERPIKLLQQQPALNNREQLALEQLVRSPVNMKTTTDASGNGANSETRSPLAGQIARIISGLGYQQERELTQLFQGKQLVNQDFANGERLKSLLLQLNQSELPNSTKNKVELMINRITGQQLVANEQQGPIHQIAVQIPLQLGLFQTDLTVQWEGKKTKSGEIDPEHCRILFYLELEQLKETIIDVQIQKKVISLHIFNEHPRPAFLMDMLQPLLSSKLEDFGYQLSTIKWKNRDETTATAEKPIAQKYQQYTSYQGVDVRI